MRLAIFAIALIVRIAAVELSGAERVAFGDGADYIAHAQSLCAEHAYPDRGNLPFFRAPGLPFFIAAVTGGHPSNIRAIKYALSIADSITAVIIAGIALLLFGEIAGWLAGIGAALHPIFIASVCDVRSEPLFMLLLVAAIALLLNRKEAFAGVATALAALTRPSALLCIPLFAIFRPRRAVAFCIGAALTLAPWVVRNAVRYHELIVVNDAGGFSFWRGTAPETIDISNTNEPNAYREKALRFEVLTIAATAREIDAVASSPMSRSREWTRRALQNIRRNIGIEARFTLEKAWLYWRPWLNSQEYSRRVVAASLLFFVPFYLLGFMGARRRADVLIFFAAMWLAHLPYQMGVRLRLPFVDPLMLVLAASELCRRYARADTIGRSAAPPLP